MDSEEESEAEGEENQSTQEEKENLEVGGKDRPKRNRKVPERYGDYRVHSIRK